MEVDRKVIARLRLGTIDRIIADEDDLKVLPVM